MVTVLFGQLSSARITNRRRFLILISFSLLFSLILSPLRKEGTVSPGRSKRTTLSLFHASGVISLACLVWAKSHKQGQSCSILYIARMPMAKKFQSTGCKEGSARSESIGEIGLVSTTVLVEIQSL